MSSDDSTSIRMPSIDNFMNLPITNWEKFWNIAPKLDIDLFTLERGDGVPEQKVIDQIGSYGKQLGRLTEVVDLLLDLADGTVRGIGAEHQAVILKFRKMAERRKEALARFREELGPEDKERVFTYLEENPDVYAELVRRHGKTARSPRRRKAAA